MSASFRLFTESLETNAVHLSTKVLAMNTTSLKNLHQAILTFQGPGLDDFFRRFLDCRKSGASRRHINHNFGQSTQIPHGIYDVTRQTAHIHLNTSNDTSERC